MKKIRLLFLLILLCLGIGARADNIVTLSAAEGSPGDEVTVSIGLMNTDAVSSLQVSIPLDENVVFVEGSGQLGNRGSDHTLTMGVKDGELNVFVYSLSMEAFSGNDGEVASFRLKLGNQPHTTTLTPSKMVFIDVNGIAVSGSSQSGSVTTRCAKAQYNMMEVDFGEIPIRSTYTKTITVTNVGNADLTISDLDFSDVSVFSSTTALPVTIGVGASKQINITYAPVERGSIDKTLKVVCNSISKLNTIALKAQPFAVNELHIQPATGVSDEEVTVRMTMNNMDAITGYQVEFNMPSQLEYVDGSFTLSDRKQDHVAIATLNDHLLRLMVYSSNDKPLTGDDGEIGSFRVKLKGRNGVMLTPTKTVLSATINNHVENVVSAVYGGQITIQSPRISCNSSLDFGAVSVTEECEKTFTIRNTGNAPLTINRIVFDKEALSVKESLPFVVSTGGNKSITVVYSSIDETAFNATMQIYSNDPDLRLKDVQIKGSRFAPNYLSVVTPDKYEDENMDIELWANTYDAITAMQFDIDYPSEVYEPYENNYTVEARGNGITMLTRQIDEHTIRCFCYILNGGNIAPGDSRLMTISLKPKNETVPVGQYSLSVKNIKLGTSDMTDKYAGSDIVSSFIVKEGLSIPTTIEGIAKEKTMTSRGVFSINGQLIDKSFPASKLKKGVYIYNGRKYIVK